MQPYATLVVPLCVPPAPIFIAASPLALGVGGRGELSQCSPTSSIYPSVFPTEASDLKSKYGVSWLIKFYIQST